MEYTKIKAISEKITNPIVEIKTGMSLEIHEKVWDWDNNRIWKFKCLVIKVQNPKNIDWTFTVRWHVSWIDVEKIYPLSFGKFEKIILLDEYKIRKSKLYYIREKVWKSARMKSRITPERRDSDISKKQ
mgnify:CR=1 FL=1